MQDSRHVVTGALKGRAHALQLELTAHHHVRGAAGYAVHGHEGASAAQHFSLGPGGSFAGRHRRLAHAIRGAGSESLLENGNARASAVDFHSAAGGLTFPCNLLPPTRYTSAPPPPP